MTPETVAAWVAYEHQAGAASDADAEQYAEALKTEAREVVVFVSGGWGE